MTNSDGCISPATPLTVNNIPTAPTASTNVTNASSVGASDGAVNLTVTGGTAPYSFSWSNGATTEDISGLNAGTYNVTITDDNGCTASASATVSENAAPINTSTAVTNATCNGDANGAINLTVTGGTPPYSFSWSNGATTEDISGLIAGNYSVTITDDNGSTANASATVIQPPALNTSTNVTDASSVGATDGAIDLTVTGGTAPYSFSWSNGATTEDISGLNAGTYNVTITDDNGCTTSASATVSENAAPINTSTAVTNATCNGDANGAINLTVTGGTPPYSFSWSNGATTEDISGLIAGNYSVTITDDNGSTANASATVIQPPALNTSTNVTDASSVGASDGAVNLTVTGGTAPYSFSWSNGATTEDISGLNAGTYNVTITDDNGCTTSASATVSENAAPINTSTAVTNATCNGDANGAINLTVTGGTPPYSFSWSNGATTEDISGLIAGNYSVTITDDNGSTANASATVIQPPALNTSTNVTDASSVGATDGAIDLTVTGGTAPYSFSWSNGATTEDISGLNAGTYNVTITDDNGCTASASATVSENTSPIYATIVITNATCNGGANGAIDLTVTGITGPYSFNWSNGATTEDISGLIAGNYSVTITDDNGTTANVSATVSEPPALNTSTNVTDASSVGASDGAIDLTVTGGTAPYSFSWSNGATTEDISGLNAGTYNVTITDDNGCTASASATVSENAAPINTSTAVTNATCNGDANGAINLTVTGGTPPYSFSWSNGATTEDISGLIAGNYSVTITDNDGTTANASATVIQPPALNTSTNVTDASSVGASDGAVNLTVTGGTAPYSFSWSNGATTEDISGLNAGTYNVTITDDNGCTASASATVSENAAPINTSTSVTNATCNGDANGAINLTVTGGTPPYSFSWSNGATTEDISGLIAGNYSVTITDDNGSTANASATVIQPPALNASTNVTDASSVGASDGAVNLTVTGGTAPYSFSWSNGATTEDISGLNAGTYNVTITDDNGCTTSASATVSENAAPINTSTAVTNATCNGDANGAINLTVTGGTPPYSFSWSNGATTEDISGLIAGNYSVTITDDNGSTANASATVIQPPALNASTNVTDASSVGASDGAVNLTVTGGTAPYSFSWSNGATTEDISGLNAGTYNVTITDDNGCTTSASATVSENAAPINTSTAVTNATCNGDANGAINLTVTGGTPPYSFSWSNGATTEDISGLIAGNYSVTITDDNGSTANASATVIQPPALNTPSQSIDCSPGFGNATVIVTSPTGAGLEYSLDGGGYQTSVTFTGVANGNHSISVRNGSGCSTIGNIFSVSCGCVNGPAINMSSTAGSTCGTLPVTIGGNTFINATTVSITHDGAGNVSPATAVASPFTFSYTPAAGDAGNTVIITITTDNPSGAPCTPDVATYSLIVNAIPSAPVSGATTQPTCALATGSVVLSGLQSGNWTINPGAISGSGSSTTIPGLSAATYSFTVTNASGCTSPGSTNVVIDSQPVTPIVPDQTTTILSGSTFTVTPAGVPGGTTYTWTVPSYTGSVSGGSAQAVPQSDISGTLNGSGTAIYTVTPTSGACIGSSFSVTVTVNSGCVPVSIGVQPSGNNMCATSGNASFTVVANGTAPFTYQWEYNNGGTWASVANGTPAGATYTNANTSTLSVAGITAAGNYQYRSYITNCIGANNATSNVVTLTVNPTPAAPTASNNSPLCAGTALNLTTPAVAGATYAWTGPDSFSSTLQNPTITGVTVAASGTYNVTVTLNGCTSIAGNTTVVVNPAPVVSDQTTSIISGGTFTVTPIGVPIGTTYTWTAPTYTGGVTGGSAQTTPQSEYHRNINSFFRDWYCCLYSYTRFRILHRNTI